MKRKPVLIHHGPNRRSRHPARAAGLTILVAISAALLTACSSAGAVVVTTTVPPSATNQTTSSEPTLTSANSPASGSGSSSGSATPSESETNTEPSTETGAEPSTASQSTTPSSPATISSTAPKPVHVSTFEGDGDTFGIGMAVMVLFSAAPTDASAFEQAATVTVDGQPATGAWFWQEAAVPGYVMEALYREKDYWPAHSTIDVDLPVQGLSAGPRLAYDDSLTVKFDIGAAHISHVDNAQHVMTVTSDAKVEKTLPVSLGSASTPTYNGVKVVMAKNNPKRMRSDPGDPHPYDIMVPWSVRVTNSGEFVHAASWNTGNIGSRNTSHGCTNLDVSDAKWFYKFSLLGDVVDYPNANPAGKVQPSWDGWGWWNMPWTEWAGGGMLSAST